MGASKWNERSNMISNLLSEFMPIHLDFPPEVVLLFQGIGIPPDILRSE
jgi:hypothetical protein